MLKALILGLIQGLTEFIPISSSGHVLFFERLFNYSTTGFDAAIHLATCLAAIVYFRKDIVKLVKSVLPSKSVDEERKRDQKLAKNIVLATVPAILLAAVAESISAISTISQSLLLIGISSIFFGLLLYFVDKRNIESQNSHIEITTKDSVLIGAAQVIAAVFPGASRSGITLTTAFARNISRVTATRFIFLISIPITGVAALYEILIKQQFTMDINFAVAFVAAFVSGMLAIHYLLILIRKMSLQWLCAYRVLFGIVVIAYSLSL
jgi:undecaprenyl-diphosphatase